MPADAARVIELARESGFELAGIAPALPAAEAASYAQWIAAGMHGKMGYLAGRRGEMRADPRTLLPSARSILSVGKVYNTDAPYTRERSGHGWISRYAWGAEDYHHVLNRALATLVERLQAESEAFEFKICVDTSPLLERAYAQAAGLGWIGRNTCVINEQLGSWFFLGEVLLSLDLSPSAPPPFRCGTCTACIDACPTDALVPVETPDGPEYTLDARRCISYTTIELKGEVPEEAREGNGHHIFGCDICQDVCPWNRPERAATTEDPNFAPAHAEPNLAELARFAPEQFRERFRGTPMQRSKWQGFLRNIAIAMGNSGEEKYREPLEQLAVSEDEVVALEARWALRQLVSTQGEQKVE